MAIGTATGSIVVVFHNDGLLAGIPALQYDDHLSLLQNTKNDKKIKPPAQKK